MKNFDRVASGFLGAVVGGAIVLAAFGWLQMLAPQEADIEARLREKISIDARDDAYLYNGADLYMYSDDHSTQKLHIDGATGNIDAEGTLDVAGGFTPAGGVDLNGVADALVLDADADTTLSAPTDDQIDIEIGGADDFRFLANSFEVQSGSVVDLNGAQMTVDADADTTMQASADDLITVTLGAATGQVGIVTGNLHVGNGVPGTATDGEDLYVEGGLEIDGTARLDGTVNAAADVDIGTFLNLSAQSAISLTEGAIITPTGSLQPLTSAAAVTTSTTTPIATAGFEAGDLLILRNDNASDVITIDGTGGTVECKADIALGTKDTVTLILDTSAWHCLANYDNS